MAVWSYTAQAVLAETVATTTLVTQVSPASAVAGQSSPAIIRRWLLQYTTVTTAECASMAAFFSAQHGPHAAFDWVNPNDAVSYRVRFDDAMRIDLFTPGFLRTGEIPFVSLVGS